jgi:hypothetical protein
MTDMTVDTEHCWHTGCTLPLGHDLPRVDEMKSRIDTLEDLVRQLTDALDRTTVGYEESTWTLLARAKFEVPKGRTP